MPYSNINQTPIIRTVLGDIRASELGICYPHEHVFGAPPAHLSSPDFELTDQQAALRELQWFHEAGGRALVDMSTLDYNRDVLRLKQVSEATGVHIVATTGFNKDRFSKPLVDHLTDEQLDQLLLNDVTVGIDRTDVRAGVLKAASSLNSISSTAQRVFESVARIHIQTHMPYRDPGQAAQLSAPNPAACPGPCKVYVFVCVYACEHDF